MNPAPKPKWLSPHDLILFATEEKELVLNGPSKRKPTIASLLAERLVLVDGSMPVASYRHEMLYRDLLPGEEHSRHDLLGHFRIYSMPLLRGEQRPIAFALQPRASLISPRTILSFTIDFTVVLVAIAFTQS